MEQRKTYDIGEVFEVRNLTGNAVGFCTILAKSKRGVAIGRFEKQNPLTHQINHVFSGMIAIFGDLDIVKGRWASIGHLKSNTKDRHLFSFVRKNFLGQYFLQTYDMQANLIAERSVEMVECQDLPPADLFGAGAIALKLESI